MDECNNDFVRLHSPFSEDMVGYSNLSSLSIKIETNRRAMHVLSKPNRQTMNVLRKMNNKKEFDRFTQPEVTLFLLFTIYENQNCMLHEHEN